MRAKFGPVEVTVAHMTDTSALRAAQSGATSRWAKWLSLPRCVPILAVLGMLLTAPALNSGLAMDDFIHWAILMQGLMPAPHPGSPWGLFSFIQVDVEHTRALKEIGQIVWWASNDVRLDFWRPLSEFSHWLDYRLWPDSPPLMHVQSTLWYGLLICLMGRLYFRLDNNPSRQTAGLATLFFALSSLHLTAVTWLSARNQLIAGCFTLLCITAYHDWRHTRLARHGWLAALMLAAGLLSAEAAVATMAYLVAYALCMDTAPNWSQRLRPLLPFMLIVVAWRIAYHLLGYGAANSAFYIDPAADPARFAGVLLLRLPTLLLSLLVGIASPMIALLQPLQQAQYAVGATAIALLFFLAAHAYGLWSTRLARFYGLGAFLSIIPFCASQPADRLLQNAELGMSALLAMLLTLMLARQRQHRGWLGRGRQAMLWVIMAAHLLIFPVQTVFMSTFKKVVGEQLTVTDPLSLPDARFNPSERMVLLNPPIASMNYYYPLVRQYHGMQNPRSMHALVSGDQPLKLTVLDAQTLEITGTKGFGDQISRDIKTHPFTAGQTLPAGPIQVTVMSLTPLGAPLTVRVHFDSPITSAPWRFYTWTDSGYTPIDLPAPGQTIHFAAPDVGGSIMKRIKRVKS